MEEVPVAHASWYRFHFYFSIDCTTVAKLVLIGFAAVFFVSKDDSAAASLQYPG